MISLLNSENNEFFNRFYNLAEDTQNWLDEKYREELSRLRDKEYNDWLDEVNHYINQ